MDWGSLAGSVLQAGSSLFGGLLGSSGQAAANAQQQAQFESNQATQNREFWANQQFAIDQHKWSDAVNQSLFEQGQQFEANMSNTAYRRATADMKAAGLNPILAYQQGGANTPTVSASAVGPSTSATPGFGSTSSFGNVMGPLAHGISSAGQAASTYAALRNMSSLTDKADQDTKKSAAETDQVGAQTELTKSQDEVAKATKVLTEVNQTKARQETATSAAQAAAAVSAAANNNQDTANKAVQQEILRQEAVTAKAKAQNATYFGQGTYGDLVGTVARTGATAVDQTAGAYSRYIGQPFSDFVHGLYNWWKGKP